MADRETELTGRSTRRGFVKRAGVGAGGLLLSGAAAQPVWARARTHDASNTIKIGFVSPLTGPAAGFGEPDPYVIGLAKKAFAPGLTIGGQHYTVEIHEKDSQSAPQRAAQVASDLIHGTNVDLMLATSTPEVVNPVSDASEAAGVPCISTVVPWEAWYFGRGAKPGKPSPFRYTFHFCFGVGNFADTYTSSLSSGFSGMTTALPRSAPWKRAIECGTFGIGSATTLLSGGEASASAASCA